MGRLQVCTGVHIRILGTKSYLSYIIQGLYVCMPFKIFQVLPELHVVYSQFEKSDINLFELNRSRKIHIRFYHYDITLHFHWNRGCRRKPPPPKSWKASTILNSRKEMKTDITILVLSTFIRWTGVHVIFGPSMGQTQTQVDVLHFGVKETQHVFTVQSHYTGQHRQFTQNSL